MSALACKLLACIAMFLDHYGYVTQTLMPYRLIGRIAFPLYAFLLAEGFFHTKNLRRYQLRLLFFAFASEIPYNLMCTGGQSIWKPDAQNIFFTLFLAILALEIVTLCRKNIRQPALQVFVGTAGVAILCVLAEWCHSDYGAIGVLTVVAFCLLRDKKGWLFLSCVVLSGSSLLEHAITGTPSLRWACMQEMRCAALIPIVFYNGKKGWQPQSRAARKVLQYGFYAFYPLHILLLVWLTFWQK